MKKHAKPIFGRLLAQARPYWGHLAALLVLSFLAAPLALLGPLPLKIAVDSVIGSQPPPAWLKAIGFGANLGDRGTLLLAAVLLFVALAVLNSLQALGSWVLQTYTGEKLVLEFRSQLFAHVQRLSLTYHDTQGTADSLYRIQWDAPYIQYLTVNGFIPLFTSAVTLAGMFAIIDRIDRTLALIALTIAPVLFLLTRTLGQRLRARWGELKKLDSAAMRVVQEVLASVRVVKAFVREEHEQRRFEDRCNLSLRKQIEMATLQGGFDALVAVILAIGGALTLFIGVRHVQQGMLTIGQLVLVMAYVAQLYEPLRTLSKKVADLQTGLASAERAFALLDESPDVAESPHARPIVRARGAVAFRDVTFSYDGQRDVLSGVNLEVPPGARVGIQGKTGAGKSTLAGLLMRFWDPVSGQILLDGLDLRDYKVADLRNQYAIVLQDAVLFSTTIAENIAYGRPEASEAEIMEAARNANAHDFIRALPGGYDTMVGERGMRLSGGERQRISLARAFLKDAPILILDEPTSSVDVRTEAGILDAMERLMRGRTVFLIAHRLNTLAGCDVRVEVQQGRLTVIEGVAHA